MDNALSCARNELSRLAQGGKPDGVDISKFGKFAPVVQDAYTIHAENGTEGILAYLQTPQIAPLLAGDPNAKPTIKIYYAADALKPQPPINWVVQDVLSAGSVSLVVGDAGSGKTWACLDLAVSVATGENWLGYIVNGGPVLVIDEESGPRRLSMRRGHNADGKTPLAYTTLNRFDLGDPEHVAAICDAIQNVGARLVILDAFMDLLPGRDENAVKDTLPALLALRDIGEQTGAALVVIHHANKSGGYRGSSAIKGAVDLMLAVENDGNGTLTVKSIKARDVEHVNFGAEMSFSPRTFNLSPAAIPATKPVYSKGEAYVLRYLGDKGASETDAITSHADTCSDTTARKAIYALASKGLATRVDPGGVGSKATYDLTQDGRVTYAAL